MVQILKLFGGIVNCTECAITDDGCWMLRSGKQVVFKAPLSAMTGLIKGVVWNRENEGYYARRRLPNGQFCMIAFYRCRTKRTTEYNVL